MDTIKILLIEDDELTSDMISKYLEDCNFSIEAVFSAIEGLEKIKRNRYDLILLDINLPDFDGYEFLKSLRKKISTPVIILSGYSDTKSKILAFKYGASDYMVKPIDFEELEARIWVHLSKQSKIKTEQERNIFELHDSYITFKNKILDLTGIEFEILSKLIKNKNQTVSREELINTLSTINSPRSLDNHIKNIRKKVGDDGNKPKYIKTIYGVGYRLQLL